MAHQGYGFCEFLTEEDAEYACKIMNQIKLWGKPIRVNKVRLLRHNSVHCMLRCRLSLTPNPAFLRHPSEPSHLTASLGFSRRRLTKSNSMWARTCSSGILTRTSMNGCYMIPSAHSASWPPQPRYVVCPLASCSTQPWFSSLYARCANVSFPVLSPQSLVDRARPADGQIKRLRLCLVHRLRVI